MTCKSLQRTWTRTVGSVNMIVWDVRFSVCVCCLCVCACVCIVLAFVLYLVSVCVFSSVRVYCICAFIFVSQSLAACASVPRCACVSAWVYLYECTYKRVFATLVYLHISDYDCPFRRICTRLAPNYSLTFTHPQTQTHTSARILCTHSHTRVIISSCWSVTMPLLLMLLTSQEYAVAYASLFRWFFMLLLRLVYGLHYMPYHALTLINAHSRAYFAHFGRTHRPSKGGQSAFFFIFIAIPTCLLC